MKKTIATLIMLLVLLPCMARNISLVRIGSIKSHGGTLAPAVTRVSADFEDGAIFLMIGGYTGSVQANVCDSQGNVIGSISSSVSNNGTLTIPVFVQSNEDYTLDILLSNTEYYGFFKL
jgi:hypothetical protein